MKTLVLCILLAVVGLDCACPDEGGWIPVGESCYLISVEAMDWYSAQQASIGLHFT